MLAPLSAAGCGWRPLYADAETGPADDELRAIRVAPIRERVGQRLELALRRSLNPDGVPTSARYILNTTLTVARLDLGIQSQGLGTRGRVDLSATIMLADIKTSAPLLNTALHTSDSFDIVPNEYASIVAEEDARTRAAEELRRDIVDKLTLFMQRRVAAKT
ncbi:MAG TPA: LPS assembly lipoprotein LptE [Stellaceae bacterium]|jgi:hypothetical protein|nr:LPS assembly lipoprotein LptE [Stellaceae bacterium]